MKIQVTLSDSEVRDALKKAIKEKLPDLDFQSHKILLNGSVKIKGKSVRKEMLRVIADVESYK